MKQAAVAAAAGDRLANQVPSNPILLYFLLLMRNRENAFLKTYVSSKVARRDLKTCFQVHPNLIVLPSTDAQPTKLLFVGLMGLKTT